MAGLTSGAVIGFLSAFLAAFMGISQIVVSPAVAIGNALLCVVYSLLARRPSWHVPAMLLGAVVKCAFLWLTVPLILGLAGLPEKQTTMLSIMFSWPQAVSYTHLMKNNHVWANKLSDIAGKSRLVPEGHGMLEVARRMGISLG